MDQDSEVDDLDEALGVDEAEDDDTGMGEHLQNRRQASEKNQERTPEARNADKAQQADDTKTGLLSDEELESWEEDMDSTDIEGIDSAEGGLPF